MQRIRARLISSVRSTGAKLPDPARGFSADSFRVRSEVIGSSFPPNWVRIARGLVLQFPGWVRFHFPVVCIILGNFHRILEFSCVLILQV